MEELGFCGIDCTVCPAYQATIRNDAAMRANTAAEWTKMFGNDFEVEDIVCYGCQEREKPVFGYCDKCRVRLCALERGVLTCAECSDYVCEKLAEFYEQVPQEKARMDKRHEVFLRSQRPG